MENWHDSASKHDVPLQCPVESLQSSESFVSANNKLLQEDVKNKKFDIKQNIAIPADCFTAVSMPKNWRQVERLKQQRLMLHQKLFARKLNVKNHENHSVVLEENTEQVAENRNLETFQSDIVLRNGELLPTLKKEKSLNNQYMYSANAAFDEDTDSSSSDDDMPRLQIAESCTSIESENIYNTDTLGKDSKSDSNFTQFDGVTENSNQKMDLGGQVTFPGYTEMEEEFDDYEGSSQNSHNSSDLGDISASKINEALHNAIFSASDNKIHEESRIKQVLYSLKMKAEEKEDEHLGSYKIAKPLATTLRLPSSSSGVSLVADRNFNIIETYPQSNLKVARNCSNIADLNPTKYVGLPVNVDSLSKQHFDFSKRNEDSSSVELKQIQTSISDSAKRNGKNAEHLSELDFRNIALQKLLANQRLGTKRKDTVRQNEVQENCKSADKEGSGNAQKTESLTIPNGVDSKGKKEIVTEKTVASQIVFDHTIPKQRKLSEKQRELCSLKLEILNKRIQAKSSESLALKEQMLIAEQKQNEVNFKAKQEVLKAELKLKEHELKMAKSGIFFPRCRALRYRPSFDRDIEEVSDSEEEMTKNGIDGCKVGSKNKPDESEGAADNNKSETENQLAQTKIVTKNGPKQINPESDKTESDNTTKSSRNQSDSILREFINSGKEMVSNLQKDVLEKQAYTERKLNVRPKRKRTVKSRNSSMTETETGKQCSPAQVNDKNKVEFETKSSSINCPVTTAVSLAQNGPSSVSPPPSLASAVVTSSNYMSKENVPVKVVSSTHLNASTPAQRIVIPQATILQSSLKSDHAKIQGIQRHSSSNCHPNRTERFILPSGFVKDESTNQMFHTYRFNGHTFAMIDNKLYQIHLNSTDGKTKTVIGAMIPTTASANTPRPGMVTAEPAQNSPAVLKTTASCSTISTSKFSSLNTTVGAAAKVSQKPVAYRFPVNIVPSASKPSQPLNLLILGTSPISASTQSTQVIRKPLMHAIGGNNYNVRAQLQQTLGQKVSTASPKFASGLGTNIVQLPVTFTHTVGFQAGNSTSIPLTLGSVSVTQPMIQNQRHLQKSPVRSHMINTGGQSTKFQAVSPRTAKSLLTNKTYVMMDTAPAHNAKLNVQSPRSIEYCGSVVLSSASNQKPSVIQKQLNFSSMERQVNVLNSKSESKTAEVSVSNTVASNGAGTSWQSLSVHADDMSDDKIIHGKTTVGENEAIVDKGSKANSDQDISVRDCSKYALRPKSPAKICSSMDSCIYTAKRKRKGTPLKKAQVEDSSVQSQLQKMDDIQSLVQTKTFTEEKSQDQKAEVEQRKTLHEKITEPVPFLDFPARIVSTSKSGCTKKLSEIVASPNGKVKSGQNSDTSLDEEKMAEMISFANMLEEKTNEKGAVTELPKRKRLFKKRKTGDKKNQELDSIEIISTDSEQETRKGVDIVENCKQQDIAEDVVNLNKSQKKSENESDSMEVSEEQSTSSVSVNKDIAQHEDRNMFDKLEQLVSKQNSLSESCNESNDSYDSSDLETYEKFVSNRKATSTVIKPKSQLIESYYTSQGMKEMKRCNIEPKHSFPLSGSYITSESSPKIAEMEAVSSESSPKKAELKADELNTQKKTTPKETTSLNSKSSTLIPEKRQDTGLVNMKSSVQNDMTLHSKPVITQNTNLTESNQRSYTVGGKQVKRLIKTKFIILKGDICDRWFEIKQKTGFGEMSDPKFIHYLLRSEEERQTKMNETQVQKDNSDCPGQVQFNDTEQSREINAGATDESFSVDSGSKNSAVDLNNNNNADSCADEKVVVSDTENLEDTIVNVTDTPPSSPGLSAASTPEILFQTCTQNTGFFQNDMFPETTTSVLSSQEKLGDDGTEILPCTTVKSAEKIPVLPDHSRKRPAEEIDVTEAPAAKKQFAFLSGTTQRQMLWAVSLFREWLKEKGEVDTQFEYRDAAWLNDKLARFYTDALSHEGTPYSTNILQTFRRSLSLYLTSNCNSQNVRISISQDQEYTASNEVLTDLILTETRQSTVTFSTVTDNVSYPINEDDMEKLYSTRTLSDDDPTCLMWKVWFDITFHLCKGKLPRNFWRSLTKRSLVLESDVNGVFYTFADYVYIPPEEQAGRMYATPNEPERCPVRSTSFYLSKLCANCDAFFQCSKRSWHKLQERWYLPVPVSREKLDKIMSKISEHAQLSRLYDGSCVILTAKLRGIETE